jgi:hypothetical protein
MYLTDVLTYELLSDESITEAPMDYIKQQGERMGKLCRLAVELEHTHHSVFGDAVPFAPGFLMYIDYLIHISTTGRPN